MAVSRKQLEVQPHIRDRIIQTLRDGPTKSFRQVAVDIGEWCSPAAIHRWITSFPDYTTYIQRPLPLLSTKQRAKHVEFAKHVRNNWGLTTSPRKILWIHYDEKWFFGCVPRVNAKLLEQLGLEKQYIHVLHKNHINKVMGVAFTGLAFDGNVESGGHGLKIGFYRCHGARIAKKQVRESRRDEDDNLKYDGPVVRNKGDMYMVDCNVTGSDPGTSDQPKFSLKGLFHDVIFPKVKALVESGGEYEGYENKIVFGSNTVSGSYGDTIR